MNVLIVGDGQEETAWGHWFLAPSRIPSGVSLSRACMETTFAGFPIARDLDDGLASPGLALVVVGGPLELRGEALRRAAAEGLAIICLHPPGEDSEAYYQVALSKSETGAVVVPDLPLRLHPGVAALARAMTSGDLGTFRGIRHECSVGSSGTDLVRHAFARAVDVVRALRGGDRGPDRQRQSCRRPSRHRARRSASSGPGTPGRSPRLVGAAGTVSTDRERIKRFPDTRI